MKVILYGFGGFALEFVEYLELDSRLNVALLGYVDDAERISMKTMVPFLGTGKAAIVDEQANWLIAVGNPQARKQMLKTVNARNANLFTFVHSTAMVSPSAEIGAGSIVCPYAIINAKAKIGQNVVVNVFSSIGHGASIGDHSVLSPYASMSGDSSLGDCCFLGTRATVFPKVKVGKDCMIDSHSIAKLNVPDGHLVSCRGQYLVVKNRMIDL